MADLIRTMESDLFGAYEWAAELYEDLKEVPEATDRLAVWRGLMRAHEALAGGDGDAAKRALHADASMRAAEGLVAAEEGVDEVEMALVARLDAPRDALFVEPSAEAARAFLAAFDPLWQKGEQAAKQALVPDAILAALANSNVLAGLGRATLAQDELRRLHSRAAELYEEIFAMLNFRVGTGSLAWRETAQSAAFRASAAWRLAGDEARAKRAAAIAGPVEGAGELQGRGLKR